MKKKELDGQSFQEKHSEKVNTEIGRQQRGTAIGRMTMKA